ncbi:DUF5131 family protein [Streptomyces sp. NPDC086549]|uniref:DUF5131 family protein n=1 Tax=Streptomyces sp. NPDC086549 TaxID=3365752 RepID=UPI0038084168
MSTTTKIEWTRGDDGAAGATWNPVTGCTKVSEGCDVCYAEVFAERWRGIPGHPFEQGFDVRLWPDRLELPLRWRKPRRVFVNSMSDLFHDQVPDDFVARVFAAMGQASRHTFQVLTKRPGRMASLLNSARFVQMVLEHGSARATGWAFNVEASAAHAERWMSGGLWPLPNVWLGTSVESQRWAKVRLDKLAQTPAAVRFASCEPLLGALDLRPWLGGGLDWVIVGGESGAKARPMHPQWARAARDECLHAGVPFFFKQWGQFAPEAAGAWVGEDGSPRGAVSVLDVQGGRWNSTGAPVPKEAVRMRRVGKGRAGRVLDGRTWEEFPTPSTPAEVGGA